MTDPTHKRPISSAISDYDRHNVEVAARVTGKNVSEFLRVHAIDAADKIIGRLSRSNSTVDEKARLAKAVAYVKKEKDKANE